MKKSDIIHKLQTLRKIGWKYYGWESNKPLPKSAAGWPDAVLFKPTKGMTVYCEIKLLSTKDHLSHKQIEFKSMITGEKYVDNKSIYIIITEENIDETIQYLARL